MALKKNLSLSIELAKAEFKLKNEGTYLGVIWYLLNPILMFLLLLIVFSTNLGKDITNYPLYLLLGIIMFNFFQQTTIESTKILSQYKGIIKSIKFPYESLIASLTLKHLFSHIIEIILLLILMTYLKVPHVGLILYPLILLIFIIFIFGISLIFSSITVDFTDLENIWVFASRLLWFATPIFYSIEQNSFLLILNLFNPLYFFITIAREVVIYNKIPELWLIFGIFIHTLIFLTGGIIIFKKLSKKFAERVR